MLPTRKRFPSGSVKWERAGPGISVMLRQEDLHRPARDAEKYGETGLEAMVAMPATLFPEAAATRA
ncbi:hypothetical protein GCM10009828_101050 [Actinoplanes couchii]|uniref:Uncharacterized protein n=1 Tax=Actinoplanes couchii TaxID=403638 RepID=A0ABQ3XLX8_9ACTN|nr:hypothetical protein Aco03nite_078840 [Actinoplanes couchii]